MTADPITRTFSVTLGFAPPADYHVLPGMTARVRIVIDPQSAFSVPVTAVQADSKKQSYVWKIDPETMKVAKQVVELGPLNKGRVLLKGGVEQGDLVATSGVTLLRDGMKVRNFKP